MSISQLKLKQSFIGSKVDQEKTPSVTVFMLKCYNKVVTEVANKI